MAQEFRVKNAMNAICKLRSTSPKNCALPQNRLQPEGKCEMSLTLSTISPQQIEALDVEQLLDFVLAGVQAPQVCLTCSFQAEDIIVLDNVLRLKATSETHLRGLHAG